MCVGAPVHARVQTVVSENVTEPKTGSRGIAATGLRTARAQSPCDRYVVRVLRAECGDRLTDVLSASAVRSSKREKGQT